MNNVQPLIQKLYFLVQELEVLAIDIARYDTAGNKFQEKLIKKEW